MTQLTGAEAIVKSLRQNKVDTIFALPGGQLDHFFDAIYKEGNGLRLISSRHEQGVAYMAYGYAKSTGKVGVYAVVPGPGLLNSTAALCTAWANHARVLCISGQIPLTSMDKGYGDLHEINDQLGLIRHLTKWAERINHPADAPAIVNEAFHQLNTGGVKPPRTLADKVSICKEVFDELHRRGTFTPPAGYGPEDISTLLQERIDYAQETGRLRKS